MSGKKEEVLSAGYVPREKVDMSKPLDDFVWFENDEPHAAVPLHSSPKCIDKIVLFYILFTGSKAMEEGSLALGADHGDPTAVPFPWPSQLLLPLASSSPR